MMSPSPLLVGSHIGAFYELKQELGAGASGTVWRAEDRAGKTIALKTLKWSTGVSREKTTDRFKSEFSILKALSHPNIGQLLDFGHDEQHDVYFFTSELFEHGSLKESAELSIELAEEFLLQMFRALEYLRAHGILHLDIKPHNIMLRSRTKNPQVALIDFGLATLQPPERPGGTLHYMAPEIIARRWPEMAGENAWPKPSHQSDLYSLGVTFYSLLTGVNPFHEIALQRGGTDLRQTLMKAHLEGDAPPPSFYRQEIPSYLDHVILKLIAKHPQDRYESAGFALQTLCYRSPKAHRPETKGSLLAYLPREGKLIGRRQEQHIIADTLALADTPSTSAKPVLAILGSPGTGKSRLLESIKPLAQQHKLLVHLVDAANPDHLAQSSLPWTEELTAGQHQAVLIDNIDAVFARAEESSLRSGLLSLARRINVQQHVPHASSKITLMAFTLNPGQLTLETLLKNLGFKEHLHHHIELLPFSIEEIEEYLASLLGEAPDPGMVHSLADISQGNPKILTELLEKLFQGDGFIKRPSARTLAALNIDFSHTSSATFQERTLHTFSKLPPESRKLLHLMACFGRDATVQELSACMHFQDIGLALLRLTETAFLERNAFTGAYAFQRQATAKLMLSTIPKEERAKIHDVIVAFLLRERRRTSAEIDRHLAHGSAWDHRIHSLERLIACALQERRMSDAIGDLRQLITEFPRHAWLAKAKALLMLGLGLDRARDHRGACMVFERLAAIPAPFPLNILFQITSYEQMGLCALRRRNLRQAKQWFDQATGLLPKFAKHMVWKLRLQNHLASVLLRSGRYDEALDVFSDTAMKSQSLPARQRHLLSNNELGETLLAMGKHTLAIKTLTHELKTSGANPERRACLSYLLAEAYRTAGGKLASKAIGHYRSALEIAHKLQLIDLKIRIMNGMGNFFMQQNKIQEAVGRYQSALDLSQHVESEIVSVELMVNLGLACSRIGRSQDAIEYLEGALDFAYGPKGVAGTLIRHKRPEILVSLADAYLHSKAYELAEKTLEKARELHAQEEFPLHLRYSLFATLTELYLATGRAKRAEELLPLLKHISRDVAGTSQHYVQLQQQTTEHTE
ncbi:MAG: protein kinase [Deltaproteobacteria bacterium]|nr:protein kinase [Deltaproteobacteria bacterium]